MVRLLRVAHLKNDNIFLRASQMNMNDFGTPGMASTRKDIFPPRLVVNSPSNASRINKDVAVSPSRRVPAYSVVSSTPTPNPKTASMLEKEKEEDPVVEEANIDSVFVLPRAEPLQQPRARKKTTFFELLTASARKTRRNQGRDSAIKPTKFTTP
jgi:hypothetical protein